MSPVTVVDEGAETVFALRDRFVVGFISAVLFLPSELFAAALTPKSCASHSVINV